MVEVEGVDVNQATTNSQMTPLFNACQNGKTEIVKLLVVARGINLEQPTSKGTTPLQVAQRKNHQEIAKLLVDAGAKYSLLEAVSWNDMALVEKKLSEDGVDVNEKDKEGRTALYVACEKNNVDVVGRLLTVEGIAVEAGSSNQQAGSFGGGGFGGGGFGGSRQGDVTPLQRAFQ